MFRDVSLPDPVTLDNAKELYATYIKPNLNKLLGFNSLAKAFEKLKIPGLEDFIRSVLNLKTASRTQKIGQISETFLWKTPISRSKRTSRRFLSYYGRTKKKA